MSAPEWFSAKTIYKHHRVEAGTPKVVFEERVVLFRAMSFEEAIVQAEAEAREYRGSAGETVYLDFVNVYHLFDASVGHRTEVYSLMRESNLSNKEYLDTFYDTGQERTQKEGGDA
jgi:Domain of unknown function (DUF4288)